MTGKTRILIVDDHPIVCEGLAQIINQEDDLEVVGDARDGREAMAKIRDLRPDLAVVDVSLMGKSGIELMSQIRAHCNDIPVLALSMYTEEVYVERALKAGARGYVTKNDATNVIIRAIRKILEGGIYLSDGVSDVLLSALYRRPPKTGRTAVDKLSDREFEVFRLIGNGNRTDQIADMLGVSVKTVDAHRQHIREKLRIKDSHELLVYALRWIRSFGSS